MPCKREQDPVSDAAAVTVAMVQWDVLTYTPLKEPQIRCRPHPRRAVGM